jgi:hypothetical protein
MIEIVVIIPFWWPPNGFTPTHKIELSLELLKYLLIHAFLNKMLDKIGENVQSCVEKLRSIIKIYFYWSS